MIIITGYNPGFGLSIGSISSRAVSKPFSFDSTKGPIFKEINKIGTEPDQQENNARSKWEADPSHNDNRPGK